MRMPTLGNSDLFVSELCYGAITFGGTTGIWVDAVRRCFVSRFATSADKDW